MNISDVEKILAKGKSQTVDFFADEDWDAISETACAFANSNGGTIVIGAEERLNESAASSSVRLNGIAATRGTYHKLAALGDDLVPPVKSEYDEVKAARPSFSLFVVTIARSNAKEQVSLPNGTVLARKGAKNEPSGIFKPKTAKEFAETATSADEQARVVDCLLATSEKLPAAKWISEQTALSLDRVEGHLERLQNAGAIKDVTRTSDGMFATVTSGNRLTLEEMAGRKSSVEGDSSLPESSHSSEAQDDPSALADSPDKPPEDSAEESEASHSVSAGDSLKFSQSVEATVVPGPIGGQIRISRESTEACLDADAYGEIVANLLASTDDDESMTFAIFGHWGRGKTYQMKRIAEYLGRIKQPGPQYSVVWFSAWKYRTTPETWAYLFEQFLQSARATQFEIPWRAAFHRRGVSPLLVALVSVAVALPTLTQKASIANALIQAVGFTTVTYLFFMFLRFRTVAIRLFSLYSFAGHADKLGLQAAIGDDLRALLTAWVSPSQCKEAGNKDKDATRKGAWSLAKEWAGKLIWPVIVFLSATLISFQLSPERLFGLQFDLPRSLGWLNSIRLAPNLHSGVLTALFLGWTFAWIGAFCLFVRPTSKKRVLLVVDDLDRCNPDQMLEIIESTMLILDDENIKQRLQVAMLVDDLAFESALAKKYRELLPATDSSEEQRQQVARVVRENQEKFFLMQLRLPPLGKADVQQVATAFTEELVDKKNDDVTEEESAHTDPIQAPPSASASRSTSGSVTIQQPSFTKNVLEQHECEAMTNALQDYMSSAETGVVIGPRTVRCLLHRYQLAREILRQLGEPQRAHELAKSVVDGYAGNHDSECSLIDRIARQVS